MKINYAGVCFQGLVRKNNEDNIYINGSFLEKDHKDSPIFSGEISEGRFAVFDGMGGECDGEAASYIASSNYGSKDLFQLNRLICDYSTENRLSFCGTTAAAAEINGRRITISNIGDSRVYHYHNQDGQMKQISCDHVRIYNNRRYITQSLGQKSFLIEPHETSYDLLAGSKYLLCSDGLTDMLSDQEIQSYMDKPAYVIVKNMQEAVMNKGAVDNTSIIVLEII